MQDYVREELDVKQVKSQKQIVSIKDEKENVVKQQRPSPKKESIINNLMSSVKSLTSQKPKRNPLLIDEDVEEDQKLQESPSQEIVTRQEANHSVLSLPQSLQQEALNMFVHQENKIQQVFEQIKPDVTVQIIETVQKGGPLSKYYVYTIKGEDMHGRFVIKRMYAQFQSLRKIITQRWPGSFIPSLKNKFQLQNQDQKQVLIRRILVNFLQGLSFSKHIYYKEEVQLFLRSPDVDITEMFEHMPALKVSDLISRFEYAFGQESKEIQVSKISEVIFSFQKLLRKLIGKLQVISVKALQLAESYDVYTKRLKKFGETMRLYEHFSLAEFTQNNREMTLLVKDDEKKIDQIKNILSENIFYELFFLFQTELIDARAFLDTVIAIDLYALRKQELEKEIMENEKIKQQVETGNMNVKTITSRKPKQEILKGLQQKLQLLYKQKQQIVQIYKIVSTTTLNHVIPTFKAIKKNNYFIALGKWIQAGGKQTTQLEAVWNFIDDSALQNIERNS